MQAGYRYDRNASAKALKASVKNSKKDNVLYGAVIKQEGVFSTITSNTDQPPTPPTPSPQTPPEAPSNASQPSAPAPSMPPSSITSLSRPVHPLASILTSGRSGLRPTSTPSVPSTQIKARLKPVDTREINVSIGTKPKSPTPSITSSEAPTVASTMISAIDQSAPISVAPIDVGAPSSPSSSSSSSSAPSSPSSDELPPLQVDLYNKDTKEGKDAQDLAAELMNLAHQKQKEAGVSEKKQITIQSYTVDSNDMPHGYDSRLIIKFNAKNNAYQFDRKLKSGSTKSLRFYPDPDTGINVIRSLIIAINHVKQNEYNPNTKKGETTGLGLKSDEVNVSSPRVIFTSRKDGRLVKKGQLYVMEPSLYKGHIRLYNKSGRPVVSRSSVSPSFQRIVKDIVERNTFEPDDYSTLDPKETPDANKFIQATKPIQPRNIDRLSNADTIWQLKKRYEVLVGELSSGNTGKLVRDEMETILRSLIRLHALNIDKGRQLIKSLREF